MSATTAATTTAHFCFMKGNEDFIQGFDGRVLILHGDVDHVVGGRRIRPTSVSQLVSPTTASAQAPSRADNTRKRACLLVQVPSAHARRLHAAVSSASKRLVLAKGKRQDSLRGSAEYAEALCAFFNEADRK